MASADNRLRKKWQDYSTQQALNAEEDFYSVFNNFFNETEFRIRKRPNEFNKVYVDVPLSDEVLDQIYTPEKPYVFHGVQPDYAIENTITGKTIYIEVKRQDGWVEGGVRHDGRGNAHERSCKFFTPGLLKALRDSGGISEPHLPFWTIFMGDMARDPCRVREVTLWYTGYEAHRFFWHQSSQPYSLIAHFMKWIEPILEYD